MENQHQKSHSHLFTVRLWQEELGDGQEEWRGKVQYIPSGEVLYFREWSTLLSAILTMLPEVKSHHSEKYCYPDRC